MADGGMVGQAIPASVLPTATVTFLLTDIEGSTRLWEQHREAMRVGLARHDALIERLVAEHSGVVVRPRGEGDSRFAVFAQASAAVGAAAAIQIALHREPWPIPEPLRVRMALHTGEADVRDGDYYGSAVNRCARLRTLAHGGQVLLSGTTAALVRDQLPTGVALRNLGIHGLKDLTEPEPIFHLLHRDLLEQFPPLQSTELRQGLPTPPNLLIGRDRELDEVQDLVRRPEVRLVTLIGPGGVGKTRLAVAVAEQLSGVYDEGSRFVYLSALHDPALVVPTAAQVLGVRERGGRSALTLVAEHLRGRRLLLVLDNFEQVLGAGPELSQLLSACAGLKVVATSREPLRLRWEHVYTVPPLESPAPNAAATPDRLAGVAAVQLFVDRARAADYGFALTESNAASVAELCRRADGLPLALELTAAQVHALQPATILARIERHGAPSLSTGARDAPARQRSVTATIAWSHDLLAEDEQLVFRRLCVFRRGCSTDAAESVCGSDVRDVLAALAALADKSLVLPDPDWPRAARFRILETISEYARTRLVASGEESAVLGRHAGFFLDLAERAEPELAGPSQAQWLDLLECEHDNLRAALDFTIQSGKAQLAMRLAGALWMFWFVRGHVGEGVQWLDRALAVDSIDAPTHARAKALNAAGNLVDDSGLSDRAAQLHEACLALGRQLRDRLGIAGSLHNLGVLARHTGDYARAIALESEAIEQFTIIDERRGLALALGNLGGIYDNMGDLAAARPLYEQSLQLREDLGDVAKIGEQLASLAWLTYKEGDPERAIELAREGLRRNRQVADHSVLTECVEALALAAGAREQHVRAACLLGAAPALRESMGIPRVAADVELCDAPLVAARAALGAEAAAAAWAEGRGLSIHELLQTAFTDDGPVASGPKTT